MGDTLLVPLLEAAESVIRERARELDALDAAIGDGDHGTNLARGLAAALADRDRIAKASLQDGLAHVAEALARETGGAGGRLYAAGLRGMATIAGGNLDLNGLARLVEAGVAAIGEEGRSQVGEKTLLDVLQPVADTLRRHAEDGNPSQLGGRVIAAAAHGLHRTSRLPAKHGRAAALAEAAVHHLDPGAWSSALLVGAVVGVLEKPTAG
jgi:dihydroxyacetone kinase-like protein